MLYRCFLPDDFAALYAIEEICFQPPFRFDAQYMLQLIQGSNSATWVAQQHNRMVGFAIVEWNDEGAGKEGYIQTLEVVPSERGRGVGRELLARVEVSSNCAGCKYIWLHVDAANAGAIRLYEARGYAFAGRAENYYARGRAALIAGKQLDSLAIHRPCDRIRLA